MLSKWQLRREGKACRDCDAKRGLLVLWRVYPQTPYMIKRGEKPFIVEASARCSNRERCAERVVRQRAAAAKRSRRSRERATMLVLKEPALEHAPRGVCHWCAEPIKFVNEQEGKRRHARQTHRGDEFEQGERNCQQEWWASRSTDARWVLKQRDGGVCAECGQVCDTPENPVGWEADHIVPLEDGGEHTLANLQTLCRPHHQAKTARENSERAQRRREAA